MQRRIAIIAMVGALLFGGWLLVRQAVAPPARPATPSESEMVPIVDGMTIDFSSGTAVTRDTAADRAAMAAALAEMEAATADVTLPPLKKEQASR